MKDISLKTIKDALSQYVFGHPLNEDTLTVKRKDVLYIYRTPSSHQKVPS